MSSVPVQGGERKTRGSTITGSFLAILVWTASWCAYNLLADRFNVPRPEVDVALAAYLGVNYAMLLLAALRNLAR